MAATLDLTHFLQRRDLLAYEQRLARTNYAYGVDLRRAAWIQDSRIGDPLMRGVDRRWNATTLELAPQLQSAGHLIPTSILEELADLVRLLRAPLPSVRVLRPDAPEPWPLATPLGTTRGGVHWLVLDVARLQECTPVERAYVLGWALGHLQCDHGPLFAAHLMAHRAKRSLGAVGLVLKPWAKVAAFSADRAATIATGGLEGALEGMPLVGGREVQWLPGSPGLDARRRALEDFDRSSLMATLRVLTEAGHAQWALGHPQAAATGAMTERLSHVFGAAARLGSRAAWLVSGGADPRRPDDAEPADDTSDGDTSDNTSPPDPAGTKAANDAPRPPPTGGNPLRDDPQLAARLDKARVGTWSIARCDQILTRRLGLL